MHFIDKFNIKHFHRKRSKIFGDDSARVLGWHSLDTQQKRFQALCQPLDLSNKSILDLGCGYGDLKHYIDKLNCQQDNSNDNIAHYVGIDQHSAFIKSARRQFINTENTEFIKADFSSMTLPKADIVMASGSLNYYSREKDYLQNVIISMCQSARYAVAFNLLDRRYFTSSKFLTSYEPKEVLGFCRLICANSQLFDQYEKNDFTIIMQR
jgi:SAM-dependent methyltransferase